LMRVGALGLSGNAKGKIERSEWNPLSVHFKNVIHEVPQLGKNP